MLPDLPAPLRTRCQAKFLTCPISDFTPCGHAKRIFYIWTTLRKLMVRAWGLVFWEVCRVRFGLGLEKENWLRSKTISPVFFSGYSYSRTIAYCGYLTSNQKVTLHNTHQKCNRPTLFRYSEKQNNWQTIKVRNFAWHRCALRSILITCVPLVGLPEQYGKSLHTCWCEQMTCPRRWRVMFIFLHFS